MTTTVLEHRTVRVRWLYMALVLLAVALVVLTLQLLRQDPVAPSRTPVASAPVAPSAPAVPPAAAPLTDTDQTVPSITPWNVDWRPFRGVWLPYSDPARPSFAGPSITDGVTAAGYARTPLGALLAAEQIGVRIIATPQDGWRQVTLAQVVPGTGRDRWLQIRSAAGDDPPGTAYAQAAGFRVVTYSPDTCVVQLVFRQTRGTLVVNTVTVLWSAGDWRLQLQPSGAASPVLQPVPALTGYIPFGMT